jgi:CspA family cold shock protein
MNTKIIIASFIVAIALSAFAFFADLYSLFPQPLAIFATSLLGGCFTCFWVCSAEGMKYSAPTSPRKSRPRPAKSASTPDSTKETGNVKWFSASKGFGFITRDNGEDIFVHFRSIMGKGHRILKEGQRVEFAVTEGSKGLQAEEVTAIKG